jgi:hypothetical protein
MQLEAQISTVETDQMDAWVDLSSILSKMR